MSLTFPYYSPGSAVRVSCSCIGVPLSWINFGRDRRDLRFEVLPSFVRIGTSDDTRGYKSWLNGEFSMCKLCINKFFIHLFYLYSNIKLMNSFVRPFCTQSSVFTVRELITKVSYCSSPVTAPIEYRFCLPFRVLFYSGPSTVASTDS